MPSQLLWPGLSKQVCGMWQCVPRRLARAASSLKLRLGKAGFGPNPPLALAGTFNLFCITSVRSWASPVLGVGRGGVLGCPPTSAPLCLVVEGFSACEPCWGWHLAPPLTRGRRWGFPWKIQLRCSDGARPSPWQVSARRRPLFPGDVPPSLLVLGKGVKGWDCCCLAKLVIPLGLGGKEGLVHSQIPAEEDLTTRDWCFSSFFGTAGPKGCEAVGSA